jgi:hypothetical protein
MADSFLSDYLNIDPASTSWGAGQNALATALPIFLSPNQGSNRNFGTALGLSLASALLGYQARRSAAEQSLQAAELGTQLMGMQTPQERLNLIRGIDSSNVQQRLLGLNAKLSEQELLNQLAQKKAMSDLSFKAEFELGETGRKLAERSLAIKRAEEAGVPLSQIDALDASRSKLGAALFGPTVEPVNVADAATMLTDPNMLQVMSKPQKEALAAQAKLTGERQAQIDDLRKQFTALPEVKNFSLIDNASRIVAKAVNDPSAVATQELVRRAVQLIEPGMAVREGEQAAIAASQSIPDQFKGQLQTALTGQGGLQADVREGILRIAQRAYEAQAERYKTTKSFYENIAKERKLPEKQISYLGEAQPWESLVKTPEATDKTSQLQAILKQLKTTANPARIAELKQQAAAIYKGQ